MNKNEMYVSEANFLLEMKIHNEIEMKRRNETLSTICCGNEHDTSRRNETYIPVEMKRTSRQNERIHHEEMN